ncbi:MAG: hypothetical protein ACUVUD_04790 [bacterium]
MVLIVLILFNAFEYFPVFGPRGGMGAGVAVNDWRNSMGLNPAATLAGKKFAAGVTYVQLYSLSGVNCGLVGVKWNSGRFATALGVATVNFNQYCENDVLINFAAEPLASVKFGIGIHSLFQTIVGYGVNFLPQIDAGILWKTNRTAIGISGRRLNSPRMSDGAVLISQFSAGGLWEPVRDLSLVLDFEKNEQGERLLFGGEFRVFPEIFLQCGVETFPLIYHGGIQVNLSMFYFDYCYYYHPALGGSHSMGVFVEWQ